MEKDPMLTPKKAKLRDSTTKGAIQLSYLEGTSFCRNAESYAELVYSRLTYVDMAELKKVHKDHLY